VADVLGMVKTVPSLVTVISGTGALAVEEPASLVIDCEVSGGGEEMIDDAMIDGEVVGSGEETSPSSGLYEVRYKLKKG
jgi:hypothetical protein